MKSVVAVSVAVLLLSAPHAVAEVSGTWVKSKSECAIPSGERDEFEIGGRKILNLEFECDVKSRSNKNGYTVDKAVCGGEGSESTEIVRYRVDASGALHIKIGKQPEEVYRYSCR